MNKFIWITVSSSGARDNEMLRQRNIQEVVFYFEQKDKLTPIPKFDKAMVGKNKQTGP